MTHLTKVRGQFVALVALPPTDPDHAASQDLLAGLPGSDAVLRGRLSKVVTQVKFTIGPDLAGSNRGEFDTHSEVTVRRHLDRRRIHTAVQEIPGDVHDDRHAGSTEMEDLTWMLGALGAFRHELNGLRSAEMIENTFRIPHLDVGLGPLQERFDDLADSTWWAHGGIGLPGLSFNRLGDAALIRGAASLTGRLRPDLTISRTSIVAVPFAVHSALQLAVRLAAQRVDAPAEAIRQVVDTNLLDTLPAEPYAVATFRADPLLAGGKWRAEKVLRCGPRTLSVDEVLAHTATGEAILLTSTGSYPWHQGGPPIFDFYGHLHAALLHFFLDVEYWPDADIPGLYAVPRPAFPASATSELLPPLFAAPFRADADLAKARLPLLNAAHPLAVWISTHAQRLSRDFAAPFNRVLREAPWITNADIINGALDKVARARTDIPAPPQEAYVRADKNGWWRSR